VKLQFYKYDNKNCQNLIEENKMKNYLFLSLILLLILLVLDLYSEEPIKITSTNHPKATAFNNGRKIARTKRFDSDSLFVIYQDLIDNVPAIMLTTSKNGINWSQPVFIDEGLFPSITLDKNDNIYAVWMSQDSTHLKVTSIRSTFAANILEIKSDKVDYYLYPSIEVTENAIHIVWQGKSVTSQNDNIFYIRLNKSLTDTLFPAIQLSADSCNSIRPTITGGLYQNPGIVHILWTDISETSTSKVMYTNFIASKPFWDSFFSSPEILPNSINHSNPSISLHNSRLYNKFGGHNHSSMILAHSNENDGGITITCAEADSTGIIQIDYIFTLRTGPNPMPCLDDLVEYECSLLWHDNGEIYYAQTLEDEFVTLPPIQVGQTNSQIKKYPNVAYKTHRPTYFDVIWTEGEKAPYDLMFRRMEKRRYPLSINEDQKISEISRTFKLFSTYPNPFNNSTVIPLRVDRLIKININIIDVNGVIVRKLISKELAAGQYYFTWDGRNDTEDVVASGLYFVRAIGNENIFSKKIVFIK
jgi:hypothetical protein